MKNKLTALLAALLLALSLFPAQARAAGDPPPADPPAAADTEDPAPGAPPAGEDGEEAGEGDKTPPRRTPPHQEEDPGRDEGEN